MLSRCFLLTILFVCLLHITYAQSDNCAEIYRDTDKVAHTITSTSPEMNMIIKRVVSGADTAYSLNFNTKEIVASDEAGLYIKLDDGHTLRYFGQKVTRKWLDPVQGYQYETTMTCNPKVLQTLKAKKISLFQIAGIDISVKDVVGEQFQEFVKCISAN
jgi:hypothetical protein